MRRKLRVAHILPYYSEQGINFMGGGDRYVYQLAKRLQEHCDVTLVTFGPRTLETTLNGLRHVVLAGTRGNPDNPVPKTLTFLRASVDLIHAYHLRSAVTSILAVLCKALNKRLVVTDLGGGGRSLTYRLKLYRLIPHFILISEFSKSLMPSLVQSRAVVVKGGVDLDRFRYVSSARPRQVVQVGRLMPHKGLNYLIAAVPEEVPLVIAGKVVSRTHYDDLLQLSKGRSVRFIIDPDDDTVREQYVHSAVTVSASVYRDMYGAYWPTSELLGLTLLESMAVGTPVVCTAVGGMPEYVKDGATGFVVPPNDSQALRQAMRIFLDDPDVAQAMGKAGHEHVQQYSWDRVASQVLAQYDKIMASASRQP